MYRDLGMKDRMKIIRNGIKNGKSPEQSVKLYDINNNGGYNQWKKDIAKKTGVDVDVDENYNYELFYNDNPADAWDIVTKNKDFQIPEIYKLVHTPQNPEMYNNLDYDSYIKNMNLYLKSSSNEYKKGGKLSLASKDKYNAYLWNLAKPFYQELLNIGLSPVAAVGILGNIALESGFNKNASNGTHFGYLLNSTGIRNWIAQQYGGYDHQHLLRYMLDGLTGNLKGAKTPYGRMMGARFKNYLNAVKDVTDPLEAVRLWEKHYEISGGLAMKEREGYGLYFYDQISPTIQQKPEDIIKLATPQLTELQTAQQINPNITELEFKPTPITQPIFDKNMFNLPPNIDSNLYVPSDASINFAKLYTVYNRNKERENLINLMMVPKNYTDDYINND